MSLTNSIPVVDGVGLTQEKDKSLFQPPCEHRGVVSTSLGAEFVPQIPWVWRELLLYPSLCGSSNSQGPSFGGFTFPPPNVNVVLTSHKHADTLYKAHATPAPAK